MDDRSADAQVALGSVLFYSEWDWVGAGRSFARALDLNPQHTEAMLLYGGLLEALGQLEHGLAMKQRALDAIRCRPRARAIGAGVPASAALRRSDLMGEQGVWHSPPICWRANISSAPIGGKATSTACSPKAMTHAEADRRAVRGD